MGLAGPVGLIHGAPPMQARTQEGVALQLARRNRHMDVVVTGLGDTARVVTQSGEGSMWTGRLSGGVRRGVELSAAADVDPWCGLGLDSVGSCWQWLSVGGEGTAGNEAARPRQSARTVRS